MGAEFLWQEYKYVSPWIGIAGYTIAAGTGILRMYNNKHWFTDIVAGAGFGILSTKMAYWLYPTIKTTFFREKHLKNITALPYYIKVLGFIVTSISDNIVESNKLSDILYVNGMMVAVNIT